MFKHVVHINTDAIRAASGRSSVGKDDSASTSRGLRHIEDGRLIGLEQRIDGITKASFAFLGRKKAIFVHGCFWHGHDCKEGTRRPKSNADCWLLKIAGNASRDAKMSLPWKRPDGR